MDETPHKDFLGFAQFQIRNRTDKIYVDQHHHGLKTQAENPEISAGHHLRGRKETAGKE